MRSLNKVQLIGNLARAPEVRAVGESSVASITVAVKESWKDRNTGEKKERAEFVKCSVWGPAAKFLGEYAAKGNLVYVEGQLQTRKWKDRDGQDRYSTEVNVGGAGQVLLLSGCAQRENRESTEQELQDDIPF